MTRTARRANLLHTGIFSAANYLRFRSAGSPAPCEGFPGCSLGPVAVPFAVRRLPIDVGVLSLSARRPEASDQTGVQMPLFQIPQFPAPVGFHIICAPGAQAGCGGCGGAHGGGGPQGPHPAGADGPPGRCQSWH